MIDKAFAKWWLSRAVPFRDVPAEKLAAEREAMSRQQEFNHNYADFLNNAVFPAVDELVKSLTNDRFLIREPPIANDSIHLPGQLARDLSRHFDHAGRL